MNSLVNVCDLTLHVHVEVFCMFCLSVGIPGQRPQQGILVTHPAHPKALSFNHRHGRGGGWRDSALQKKDLKESGIDTLL
jgi:hypothetical protein